MKQRQILEERYDEEEKEDNDLNMNNFLKNVNSQEQRVNQATDAVIQQNKKIVGINDKLDDYNKEILYGNELMDIIEKGPFESIIDGIKGFFSKKKPDNLDANEKQILNDAKNKQMKIDNNIDKEEKNAPKKNYKSINNYEFAEDDDWEIIKEKNKDYINEEEKDIEEAIKMYKGINAHMKVFNRILKESIDVIDITNENFDKTKENNNQMNERMANYK